jgi:protocatechuate 3,4-dioxygenase beta subunit
MRVTRREVLQAALLAPVLAACGKGNGNGSTKKESRSLPPTPACSEGGGATHSQTEGPFFVPRSPRRTSLIEAGVEGTRLSLAGVVLSTSCEPVRGALLDFWQADGRGEYDNEGFRLRGHQRTDARGRYRLETVVPGRYTGRTRHIHVKVQPPSGALLTTQLYFPDEPGNDSDPLFDPALLMDVRDAGGGDRKRGSFTFVVR